MKKTIFSRRYDRDKELEALEGAPESKMESFEEFWKKCQEAVVVPVPERLEGAKDFMRKIMDFSAWFSYDIDIEQKDREIQAKMIGGKFAIYCVGDYYLVNGCELVIDKTVINVLW